MTKSNGDWKRIICWGRKIGHRFNPWYNLPKGDGHRYCNICDGTPCIVCGYCDGKDWIPVTGENAMSILADLAQDIEGAEIIVQKDKK